MSANHLLKNSVPPKDRAPYMPNPATSGWDVIVKLAREPRTLTCRPRSRAVKPPSLVSTLTAASSSPSYVPCGAVCDPRHAGRGPGCAHLHANLDGVKGDERGMREAGADGTGGSETPVDAGGKDETGERGPKGVEMLLPSSDFSTKEKRLEAGSYSTRTCRGG
eukprot:607155-Hanusia_phi.AAC.13